MSDIKLAFLTSHETLMGDFEEMDTGTQEKSWKVTNPVFVSLTQNNVQLFPFLAITQERDIIITENDIRFGGLCEPAPELRNLYSTQFGSGIQLNPSGFKI